MRPPSRADDVSLSRFASDRALRRLELHIVRRLEGLRPGSGSDLAQARPYVPGEDDVRRMDWSVTARTTVPHVRDLIADRELETWAVVDLSASMRFGTAAMEKRDLAIFAVATLGVLTYRAGDRFGGYVLHDEGVRRCPARPGRLALLTLLRSLTREQLAGTEVPAGSEGRERQDLADTLAALVRTQRKQGLRVVVSDFIDPSDAAVDADSPPLWMRGMRELGMRHQVIAVEVLDPRELHIANIGLVLLRDPESGRVRELNTADRKVRERYAAAARRQRQHTAMALRRAGAAHLVLRTDRDWVTDVARFALSYRRSAARLHNPRRTRAGVGR